MVVTATENWRMTKCNLSSTSGYNETLPCGPFIFPTNIGVRRYDFLHIRAIATGGDNCRWHGLNAVGNCSSPQLQLLVLKRHDGINFTVCDVIPLIWQKFYFESTLFKQYQHWLNRLVQVLVDRTVRSMIGYWHDNVVCLSVCLCVCL